VITCPAVTPITDIGEMPRRCLGGWIDVSSLFCCAVGADEFGNESFNLIKFAAFET